MVWVRRGCSLLLALLLMALSALGAALLAVQLQLGGDVSAALQRTPALGAALADSLRAGLAQQASEAGLPEEYEQSLPLESLATQLLAAMLSGEDTTPILGEAEQLIDRELRAYALQNGFEEGPVLDAATSDFAAQAAGQLRESLENLLPSGLQGKLASSQRWLLYGLCGVAGLGLLLAALLIWLNRRGLCFLGWGAAALLGGGGLLMGGAAALRLLPLAGEGASSPVAEQLADGLLQLLAETWQLWAAILLLGGVLLVAAALLLRIERVRTLFFDKKFLLFLVVGVVNTFNGVLFSWLFSLLMGAEVAFVFGYAAALCVGYLLNSSLVFREAVSLRRLVKFALSYLPNFAIQFVMVLVLMTWLGFPKLPTYALAAVIGMPVTFLLLKLFAFAKPQK